MTDPLIEVTVAAVEDLARNTRLYTFAAARDLPAPTAGAHIDLHLANGLVRQYSLVIKEPSLTRYAVAIKLDEHTRGGSSFIHSSLKTGDRLRISAPRNHFPLNEQASHSVLIAGGIGVTPIYSMRNRLQSIGASWELHYACRSKSDAAFHADLALHPQAHFHFDDENEGRFLDLKKIFAATPNTANFYCCGPTPLMASFEDQAKAAQVPVENVHVEYFTPKGAVSLSRAFTVRLARSGLVLEVPEGRTILDVLVEAGIQIEHSCSEGICGTCETKVLEGIPDHQDSILTPQERAANNTMMVCCSRSKTPELVLDL